MIKEIALDGKGERERKQNRYYRHRGTRKYKNIIIICDLGIQKLILQKGYIISGLIFSATNVCNYVFTHKMYQMRSGPSYIWQLPISTCFYSKRHGSMTQYKTKKSSLPQIAQSICIDLICAYRISVRSNDTRHWTLNPRIMRVLITAHLLANSRSHYRAQRDDERQRCRIAGTEKYAKKTRRENARTIERNERIK